MSEHTVFSHEDPDGERPPDRDSAILHPWSAAEDIAQANLAHLQAGAAVYSADEVEVAIVESVGLNHVVLRAGFPGRPIDVPASAIARVSQDGQRLDLRVPSQEIERLVSQNAPGYVHLQAQQPETLSSPPNETADRRGP
jgi:hypothetical protein